MKLSIITINYNNKDGLQKTIESVIGQTWRDYEWIIIDGGSTDGSKELIEKYKEYFAYWCSEPDNGIYHAMNKGIGHAKGDYISCMNSGDVFHENNTLENVFSVERTADILYGDWMLNNGKIMKFPYPVEIYSFFHHNICHQAMFVKSSILIKNGFDESFILLADYKRWIELAIEGKNFDYIPNTICIFEDGGATGKFHKIRNKELARIHNDVYPVILRLSLERLDKFEDMTRSFSWNIFQLIICFENKIISSVGWCSEHICNLRIKAGAIRKRYFG